MVLLTHAATIACFSEYKSSKSCNKAAPESDKPIAPIRASRATLRRCVYAGTDEGKQSWLAFRGYDLVSKCFKRPMLPRRAPAFRRVDFGNGSTVILGYDAAERYCPDLKDEDVFEDDEDDKEEDKQ